MTKNGEVCIYCRKPAGSREHLMPRNLGGALVGTFLCQTCNSILGKLDQYLGEESIVALPRLEKTRAFDVRMAGINYVSFSGIDDVAFSIVNGLESRLLPQIHIISNTNGTIYTNYIGEESDYERMRSVIQRQIDRDFRETSTEVKPQLKTLAIINHEGKKLRLRVPEAAHLDRIKDLLRFNLPEVLPRNHGATVISAQPPVLSGRAGIDFRLLDRAVAKISFNMMAYVYGPDFVLDSGFDGVREFILNGEDNDAIRVVPIEKSYLNIPPAINAEHEIMFFPMAGCAMVVTLYNTFQFLVWYPDGKFPEDVEGISSWTFSGQRNNVFDERGKQSLEDIIRRMGALE